MNETKTRTINGVKFYITEGNAGINFYSTDPDPVKWTDGDIHFMMTTGPMGKTTMTGTVWHEATDLFRKVFPKIELTPDVDGVRYHFRQES